LGEAGVGVVSVDASATDAADAAAQLAEIGGIAAAVLLVAYPEPAAPLVRAFRASGALADMAIGDPAGRAEFSGWSQILGVEGLGVSFLRYLPARLGRAGKAIERRLTESWGRHLCLSPSKRTTRSVLWSRRCGRVVASELPSRRVLVS